MGNVIDQRVGSERAVMLKVAGDVGGMGDMLGISPSASSHLASTTS
jgi:hypothetical protein